MKRVIELSINTSKLGILGIYRMGSSGAVGQRQINQIEDYRKFSIKKDFTDCEIVVVN